jgi:hypothetical protein
MTLSISDVLPIDDRPMNEQRHERPTEGQPLSPELALVDPELAALARLRLPDPVDADVARALSRLVASPPVEQTARRRVARRARKQGDPRVLVGVAAALVVTLLLADVRVEVGRTGASAEAPPTEPAPEQGPTTATPSRPRPSRGTPGSGRTPGVFMPQGPRAAARPRQLAWAPSPGVEGYHVELYRDNARIFVAESTRAVVVVPAKWTLNGKVRTLLPGELRWYVWPVRDGRRSTTAIVQATLTIPPY